MNSAGLFCHDGAMGDLAIIEAKFQALSGRLDEATLRMWAATEESTACSAISPPIGEGDR